eukprot:11597692-Ditylum_brightwellii.AAC.1
MEIPMKGMMSLGVAGSLNVSSLNIFDWAVALPFALTSTPTNSTTDGNHQHFFYFHVRFFSGANLHMHPRMANMVSSSVE